MIFPSLSLFLSHSHSQIPTPLSFLTISLTLYANKVPPSFSLIKASPTVHCPVAAEHEANSRIEKTFIFQFLFVFSSFPPTHPSNVGETESESAQTNIFAWGRARQRRAMASRPHPTKKTRVAEVAFSTCLQQPTSSVSFLLPHNPQPHPAPPYTVASKPLCVHHLGGIERFLFPVSP